MKQKVVSHLLAQKNAETKPVTITVRNKRANVQMTCRVLGEPQYRKRRGCFTITIPMGENRKYHLPCPNIVRID